VDKNVAFSAAIDGKSIAQKVESEAGWMCCTPKKLKGVLDPGNDSVVSVKAHQPKLLQSL
jgi:hypothetical protein